MDTTNMYWEDYDDQDDKDFQYVGYTNLDGESVMEEIKNLHDQVREIRRQCGKNINIKVYKN